MTIRPTKSGVFPRLNTGVHQVALGNCTRVGIGAIRFDGGLFVGILGRGAYEFSHSVSSGYVMDKLGLTPYEGDAANIADFINDQLYEPGTVKRQGSYMETCCAK